MSSASPTENYRPEPTSFPDQQDVLSTLPMPLTSIIGRDAEIGEVLALLDAEETRLLTLTGPGGVGKTRLAIEVARRVEHDFTDGAVFIRLASIRDLGLVLPSVGRAVGASLHGDPPPVEQFATALRSRHLLLVLDNFEHLLAESPAWLPELLGLCPRLKALVTSRVSLNVGGEQRFLVPPLPVPESDVNRVTAEATSVRLFVQRARAVRPGFVLDHAVRASVGEICRKVDGLPLAIELAAARMSSLAPADIASRLTDQLSLLTGGQRDAPVRLRSMRDAIAWSYDLLSPDEQQLLQQLSVFVGGFTLEAAETVAGSAAVDGVGSLVEKSLLRLVDGAGNKTRYLMLETIREFGLERLAASGEQATVQDRHADWSLDIASRSAGVTPLVWRPHLVDVDRLTTDQGNLRAALTWLDESGRHEDLTQLVMQLRWFWYLGSHEREGLSWLRRILAIHEPSTPAHSDALRLAGQFAQILGTPEAREVLEDALEGARALGDVQREAEALFFLAVLAEDEGEYATAESQFEAARALYDQASDQWAMIVIDYHVGVNRYGAGDLGHAETLLEKARAAAKNLDDQFVQLWSIVFLILVAVDQGRPVHAMELLRQATSTLSQATWHRLSMLIGAAGVWHAR